MNATDAKALLAEKNRLLAELLERRQFGPEYRSIQEEVLHLERVVAEHDGESYAVESAVAGWPGMAHLTAVVGDAFDCVVLFANVKRVHMAMRFVSAAGYKLTDVSDETIDGHPLTGRGLTSYGAFVVKHSAWKKELESIDSVHPRHIAERWLASEHYLLCFKDRMFEAIARSVELIGTFTTVEEALGSVQVRPSVR